VIHRVTKEMSLGTDMALEAISRAVPEDVTGTMANKATTKLAWEAIRKMHLGIERVRKAKANMLRREFNSLKFRDGENVDDFGIRITSIINKLAVLGYPYTEEETGHHILQVLPESYTQIEMAIETLLELGGVPVEELIGRLKAEEERYNLSGGTIGRLNLTKDMLVARVSS
jgi:hypothetical protein